MSIKDQFNEDEWFLLSATPALIGAAMSAAEGSGVIGTVKELTASMRASVAGLKDYPDSELINALLEKAENWGEAKEKLSDYRERAKARMESESIKTAEALQQRMLDDVAACVALVDQRCSASDATAYKEWSLKIANACAMAAKEGGFLGIGGTRLSEGEQVLLGKIESALGVQASSLIA